MADENFPTPTRTDDQLVLVKARLSIGKSNILMDLQKMQKNPIFYMLVDILQNTNFFSAFTALPDVPSIYIQQFWNTLTMDTNALGITPKDHTYPFVAPPTRDLAIKTFFSDAANLKVPTKMPKPRVIPYCRFTKLIIYYLGGRHNIHKRPQSPLHIMEDDYSLNNLKFVPKGELYEVFGMLIPKDLITDVIRNSEYYQKYLEMAARKPHQVTNVINEEGGKKKKAPPTVRKGKVMKVGKGKKSDDHVDDDDEVQHALEPQLEDDEYNLQRGIQMRLKSFQAPVGGVAIREPVSGITRQLPDDTSAHVVHDTLSLADAETDADTEKSNSKADTKILNVGDKQGEDVFNTAALEERIVELDKDQAGSDPGKTPKSRPPPEEDQDGSDPRQSHVAQAGPNPEPMHEDFIAIVYPVVHENLKLTTKEQVHIENPPSSSGTLSSMKNLEDAFTFATTATTTTLLPPPPPLPQSSIDPNLANHVSVLEKRSANFDQKHQLQDKTTKSLASRVYKLEHHDLYSEIDKHVNEAVKEAIQSALQAPLCECFRDLSEVQMKEILHDRMFKSNSYRSHPDHTTLYKALEASMQRDNNDELHEEFSTSQKTCRDDQDPPLPRTLTKARRKSMILMSLLQNSL
ncbi:hypothetical protein Tco_0474580 [Tanacetum coccineum]